MRTPRRTSSAASCSGSPAAWARASCTAAGPQDPARKADDGGMSDAAGKSAPRRGRGGLVVRIVLGLVALLVLAAALRVTTGIGPSSLPGPSLRDVFGLTDETV